MAGRFFDVGRNWEDFATKALDPARVAQARDDFRELLGDITLVGKSFLDIGFGQGLSLLIAAESGARVVGCDINPLCAEALSKTSRFFPNFDSTRVPVVIGSILTEATVVTLRTRPEASADGYDVVHSWGVLHHTGDMAAALRQASSLVGPGGYLILAIYNRHWTSLPWKAIKWSYCRSPHWLQRLLVTLLYPIIWLAKLMVTAHSPAKQSRGMDFYYNVVDWVGGYPYEYASIGELVGLVEALGYRCEKCLPAQVPTGCNQFIFRQIGRPAGSAGG